VLHRPPAARSGSSEAELGPRWPPGRSASAVSNCRLVGVGEGRPKHGAGLCPVRAIAQAATSAGPKGAAPEGPRSGIPTRVKHLQRTRSRLRASLVAVRRWSRSSARRRVAGSSSRAPPERPDAAPQTDLLDPTGPDHVAGCGTVRPPPRPKLDLGGSIGQPNHPERLGHPTPSSGEEVSVNSAFDSIGPPGPPEFSLGPYVQLIGCTFC